MNSKSIPLSQGTFAIVDEVDFKRVNQFKWYAHKRKEGRNYYAQRNITRPDGSKTIQNLQDFIMEPPDGILVDHKNHNGLDNRKRNLRFCTIAQNAQNKRKMRRKCMSAYKGVSWNDGKWVAHIGARRTRAYLGRFVNEIDAALAYDEAARQRFGEFALVNFP
jgi:hypothetical protein